MRSIDAEALIKAITKHCRSEVECLNHFWYDENIVALIDNAPIVSNWGKWVISEIRCPNCLEYFQTDCYSMGELNKCPNCEAKMINEEETS